jgi:hypothetical protein
MQRIFTGTQKYRLYRPITVLIVTLNLGTVAIAANNEFEIPIWPGVAPVSIGSETIVPENPRSHYSRHVNWRPADGETVSLNPPRMSWPYWADWPNDFRDALHTFTLQISPDPDCSSPLINVT